MYSVDWAESDKDWNDVLVHLGNVTVIFRYFSNDQCIRARVNYIDGWQLDNHQTNIVLLIQTQSISKIALDQRIR